MQKHLVTLQATPQCLISVAQVPSSVLKSKIRTFSRTSFTFSTYLSQDWLWLFMLIQKPRLVNLTRGADLPSMKSKTWVVFLREPTLPYQQLLAMNELYLASVPWCKDCYKNEQTVPHFGVEAKSSHAIKSCWPLKRKSSMTLWANNISLQNIMFPGPSGVLGRKQILRNIGAYTETMKDAIRSTFLCWAPLRRHSLNKYRRK